MNYKFRKGRIVTITWKHGGEICKVLARPGQIVFDTITGYIKILEKDEYIVYNELWIKQADYLVAQSDTKPKPGFLVNTIHLRASTKYEKMLRRNSINISPLIQIEEPEGELSEIIVFKPIHRILKIKSKMGLFDPMKQDYSSLSFLLSNGEVVERGILKLLYRKANEYEKNIFKKKENSIKKNNVLYNTIIT